MNPQPSQSEQWTQLRAQADRTFGLEAAARWFYTPHRHLRDHTPHSAIRAGHADWVHDLLNKIQAGGHR